MIRRLFENNYYGLFLLISLGVGCFYAFGHRFIQDDAYISFVYARNLAEGNGLVWYPGSKEYGFTNFLHTLLVGLMMAIGIGPETATFMLTWPSFVVALYLTFRLTCILHPDKSPRDRHLMAMVATLALGMNYSFTAFASGGLETMVVTMLALWVFYQMVCICLLKRAVNPLAVSLPAALVLLFRLDSVILLLPSALLMLDFWTRHQLPQFKTPQEFWLTLLRLAMLPLLTVVALLSFTSLYYGSALPNTFYVKIPHEGENFVRAGLMYLGYYAKYQAYVPLLLIVTLFYLRFAGMGSRRNFSFLLAPVILWLCYVVYVGGDFMEFRMVVPVLPYFYIYTVTQFAGVNFSYHRKQFMLILLLATYGSNLYHDRVFSITPMNFSVRNLNRLLEAPDFNWKQAGQVLHDLLYTGQSDEPVIASKAAGAIPYFSRLRVVDQYGLNDRWIARYGQTVDNIKITGHRRLATLSYLRQRGVNLVLDHPQFLCEGSSKLYRQLNRQSLLKHLPMLLFPTSPSCYLVTYYLTPHPAIVQLLNQKRIFELNHLNGVLFTDEPNG